MTETTGRRRAGREGGGRDGRREARANTVVKAAPFIERKIPYLEYLSEENLQLIEDNADILLEEIGIDFLDDPEALAMWKEAGADVQGSRVHFPKGLCRSIIQATAPREFVQHARNPERNVIIGGKRTVLVPAYGSPFVHDIDKGRRYATIEDFQHFVKLAYMAPGIHHSGGTICEPVDLPVNKRHFDMIYSHFKYSDKPLMGSVTHHERAQDTVDMAKLVFGDEFVDQNCVLTSLINVNSPMTYDATMLGSLKVYARNNQATVVSPFILAGAMSPKRENATTDRLRWRWVLACCGRVRERVRGCWRRVRLPLVANGNSSPGPRATKVEHFATWERGAGMAAWIGRGAHTAGDDAKSGAALERR